MKHISTAVIVCLSIALLACFAVISYQNSAWEYAKAESLKAAESAGKQANAANEQIMLCRLQLENAEASSLKMNAIAVKRANEADAAYATVRAALMEARDQLSVARRVAEDITLRAKAANEQMKLCRLELANAQAEIARLKAGAGK